MNEYLQAKKEEFDKAMEFFKKEIANLRAGRVNPAMLDVVQVEAYGARSPLNAVGTISVADGRSMTISPWDKSVLKEIEKGIVEANLGLGVVNEGDKIRVTVPIMTEENRKELVKKLNGEMEKARVTIRQERDEVKKKIEEADKNKEISEDDKFKFIKELDEEVKRLNEELEAIRGRKEEEIMKV
jgi:ribosome recycling factor